MFLIERLKSGWTLLKFIRVGLGSLILYSAIQSNQAAGMFLGGLFTFIALFTDGVCYAGSNCYKPISKNKPSTLENIEYEELDSE